MQNHNADIGRNVEILFRNSIGNYPDVIDQIKRYFNIRGNFRTAISTGIQAEKVDVKLEFEDGRNVDANIKAYKASSRGDNQLTRTKISNFCNQFSLLAIQSLIQNAFINRARRRTRKSFPNEIQEELKAAISNIAKDIVKWSFSFRTSREILVLFERDSNKFYIYPMREVFRNLRYEITFSSVAGNIQIGNCIYIQRKAGNGIKFNHIPKHDLRHPGNDIQLKLKMRTFQHEMRNILLASYSL